MARTDYDVVYVARSPADMKQDEFASIVSEICNGRAAEGWRLVSAAGDYGARVTLGVWLYFAREGDSSSEELPSDFSGDEVPSSDEGEPLGGD